MKFDGLRLHAIPEDLEVPGRSRRRPMVSRTDVFTAPRIFSSAWSMVKCPVVSPSIASIRSPGRMPALAADVPSITLPTVGTLSRSTIVSPTTCDFASGERLHGAVVLSADEAGMGVERARHGSQRRFDQLGLVGPVDIFVLDESENRAEPGELTVRIVRPGAAFRDGDRDERDASRQPNGAGGRGKAATPKARVSSILPSPPRIRPPDSTAGCDNQTLNHFHHQSARAANRPSRHNVT